MDLWGGKSGNSNLVFFLLTKVSRWFQGRSRTAEVHTKLHFKIVFLWTRIYQGRFKVFVSGSVNILSKKNRFFDVPFPQDKSSFVADRKTKTLTFVWKTQNYSISSRCLSFTGKLLLNQFQPVTSYQDFSAQLLFIFCVNCYSEETRLVHFCQQCRCLMPKDFWKVKVSFCLFCLSGLDKVLAAGKVEYFLVGFLQGQNWWNVSIQMPKHLNWNKKFEIWFILIMEFWSLSAWQDQWQD